MFCVNCFLRWAMSASCFSFVPLYLLYSIKSYMDILVEIVFIGDRTVTICKILSSHHPMKLCATFDWSMQLGSGEKGFLMWSMYCCYFVLSPLVQTDIPLFEKKMNFFYQCFLPSLVEIGPLVVEKKIFKSCQHIFAI